MRVRFWGTRGSLATPGPSTLRYGGNTSCVEVRSAAGTLLILDCGTGAYALGQQLVSAGPSRGHIQISHTHWDHIQGLPFFAPLFVPGNEWDIYAPRGLGESLYRTLSGQMQYTYFPVSLDQLGATIRYHDLVEGTFSADDVRVQAQYLNHPGLTLGFRLVADGATVVYACDHEPHSPELAVFPSKIAGPDRRHAEFLAGADLVIHDAQYTTAEYTKKRGWGHSTTQYAIHVARAAGVKSLALTHHDPLRSDKGVDHILETLREAVPTDASAPLHVFAAAEGQVIEVARADEVRNDVLTDHRGFPATTSPVSASLVARTVLLGIADPAALQHWLEALKADGTRVITATDGPAALRTALSEQPSLALLDRDLPGKGGIEVCREIRQARSNSTAEMPILLLASSEEPEEDAAAGVTERFLTPVSPQYLRTRVRAWLLRTACRWVRATVPADEERRLAALHRLRILGTESEERFDRLTRLAAAAFDVPIALLTFVDKERQWFKSSSCGDLSVPDMSREAAFCAHAILEQDIMMVPDARLDLRFADNPLVTGDPRIRFYAGAPLRLTDECSSGLGTLCLIDKRPRQLDESRLKLLRDLAEMVGQELRERKATS